MPEFILLHILFGGYHLFFVTTAPGTVSNFNTELTSFTSFLVTWSPPQEPNGIITVYELSYLLNDDEVISENITDHLNFTINSEENTRIEARMRAYTSVGPGSNVTSVFTLPPCK